MSKTKLSIAVLAASVIFSNALAAQDSWVVSVGAGHYLDQLNQKDILNNSIDIAGDNVNTVFVKRSESNPIISPNVSFGYQLPTLGLGLIKSMLFSVGIEDSGKFNLKGDRYTPDTSSPDNKLWTYEITDKATKIILGAQENYQAFFNQKLTPYTLLGLGMAQDKLSYTENLANPDDNVTPLSSSNKTKDSIFYRLGAGFNYAITNAFQIGTNLTYDIQRNIATGGGTNPDGTAKPNIDISPAKLQVGMSVSYHF